MVIISSFLPELKYIFTRKKERINPCSSSYPGKLFFVVIVFAMLVFHSNRICLPLSAVVSDACEKIATTSFKKKNVLHVSVCDVTPSSEEIPSLSVK